MSLAALALVNFLFCAPPEALRLAASGERKVVNEDWAGALADFSEALRLDTGFARGWQGRGLARAMLGDTDGGLEDCTRGINLDPKDSLGHQYRGKARIQGGDADGAIADFDRALELNPAATAEMANNRGIARVAKEDLDGALAEFSKAVALNPQSAESLNNRGMIWYLKGNDDRALEDFSKSIALSPGEPRTHLNRGHLRADRREYKEALADLRRAMELSPRKAEAARFRIWLVRHGLGEGPAADKELREWLETGRAEGNSRPRILGSFLAGDIPEDRVQGALGEFGPDEKADLARAEADAESRAGNLKRSLQLREAGAISQDEVDGATLAARVAEGVLRRTRDVLDRRTQELRSEAYFLAGAKRVLGGDEKGAVAFFEKCLGMKVRGAAMESAARELIRIGKK